MLLSSRSYANVRLRTLINSAVERTVVARSSRRSFNTPSPSSLQSFISEDCPSCDTRSLNPAVRPLVTALKPLAPQSIRRVVIYKKVPMLEEIRRGWKDIREVPHLANDAKVLMADREHQHTVEIVRRTVESYGCAVREVEYIDTSESSNCDLLVCVGGDGTFLKASRAILEADDLPMIGVNSAPSSSFGFFCAADHHSFPRVMARIMDGTAAMKGLWRMRVCLNHVPVSHLVLNEMLFCNPIPSATTRYILTMDGIQQLQQSSGLWVCTASGSTGAIMGSGGVVMSLDDYRFQYRVRELFSLPIQHPRVLDDKPFPYIHYDTARTSHPPASNAATPQHPALTEPPPTLSPSATAILTNEYATPHAPPPSSPPRLLNAGVISDDFSVTSRMMSGCIYLDGSTQPIPVNFNDKITLRRSERPLRWIAPTIVDDNGQIQTADHWELVTGVKRPPMEQVNGKI